MSRPARQPFTAADDKAILRSRAEGKTWRAIAKVTGQWHVSCQRRHEVLARSGGKLNEINQVFSASLTQTIEKPNDYNQLLSAQLVEPPRRNGEALPAGHPISWGAISAEGYRLN